MQKQFAAVGDAVNRLLEPANLVQVVIVAGMITLAWSIWRLGHGSSTTAIRAPSPPT